MSKIWLQSEVKNVVRLEQCLLAFGSEFSVFLQFLKIFNAKTLYTVCTGISYKIVSVTGLNKYLHCGTSGTE